MGFSVHLSKRRNLTEIKDMKKDSKKNAINIFSLLGNITCRVRTQILNLQNFERGDLSIFIESFIHVEN
jgi:hypothetical protein